MINRLINGGTGRGTQEMIGYGVGIWELQQGKECWRWRTKIVIAVKGRRSQWQVNCQARGLGSGILVEEGYQRLTGRLILEKGGGIRELDRKLWIGVGSLNLVQEGEVNFRQGSKLLQVRQPEARIIALGLGQVVLSQTVCLGDLRLSISGNGVLRGHRFLSYVKSSVMSALEINYSCLLYM